MTAQTNLDLHQSLPGMPLAGCWKLEAGRALTLRPRGDGILRIAHGQVWITREGPHGLGHGTESGDLFLAPGKGIVVQAGQQLVMESSGAGRADPVYFSWDPLPQQQAQSAAQVATRHSSRLQIAVGQPVRDLGLALGLAAAALGRLVTGVLGLAEFLVAGRGRVLPRLESNQP